MDFGRKGRVPCEGALGCATHGSPSSARSHPTLHEHLIRTERGRADLWGHLAGRLPTPEGSATCLVVSFGQKHEHQAPVANVAVGFRVRDGSGVVVLVESRWSRQTRHRGRTRRQESGCSRWLCGPNTTPAKRARGRSEDIHPKASGKDIPGCLGLESHQRHATGGKDHPQVAVSLTSRAASHPSDSARPVFTLHPEAFTQSGSSAPCQRNRRRRCDSHTQPTPPACWSPSTVDEHRVNTTPCSGGLFRCCFSEGCSMPSHTQTTLPSVVVEAVPSAGAHVRPVNRVQVTARVLF